MLFLIGKVQARVLNDNRLSCRPLTPQFLLSQVRDGIGQGKVTRGAKSTSTFQG